MPQVHPALQHSLEAKHTTTSIEHDWTHSIDLVLTTRPCNKNTFMTMYKESLLQKIYEKMYWKFAAQFSTNVSTDCFTIKNLDINVVASDPWMLEAH